MKKQLLTEEISKEEMKKHIKDYYKYAKKHLDIDKAPKLKFVKDDKNADDFFGKTGFYEPSTMTINLYVTNRHAKDIVRSFAHELIHHYQNLNERLPDETMAKTHDVDYASKNKDLRDMEREAFEKGNMMFRDWTDSKKKKRGKTMNESKKKMKTKKKFPKKMSMDQAKEKGIPPEADVTGDGSIEGWEAGKSAAIQSKTKARKMEESKDLQSADSRLAKVLEPQTRVLDEKFKKREEIIYNELMRRFIKKDK
jgi:hypothetical protein